MRVASMRRFLSCVLPVLLLAGCSAPEPWVKPYQRANLADPVMLDSRRGEAGNYIQHVYGARESARGAEGSSGGGCGCN